MEGNREFVFKFPTFLLDEDRKILANQPLTKLGLSLLKGGDNFMLANFSLPGILESVSVVFRIYYCPKKFFDQPHWTVGWIHNRTTTSPIGKRILNEFTESCFLRQKENQRIDQTTTVKIRVGTDVDDLVPTLDTIATTNPTFNHLLGITAFNRRYYLLFKVESNEEPFTLRVFQSFKHQHPSKKGHLSFAVLVEE